MIRRSAIRLALLLALLLPLNLVSQQVPRHFPTGLVPQFYYYMDFAPILPTVDGGYLVNIGFGNPNIHGPLFDSELIKTNAAMEPEWRLHIDGNAGFGTYAYPDSTIIQFSSSYNAGLNRLDIAGQVHWTKLLQRPAYYGSTLIATHRRGNRFVATGNLYQTDAFGVNIYEAPFQMLVDTAGNLLSADSITIAGKIFTHVWDAAEAPNGSTWLVGQASGVQPGSTSNFIAQVDSNHAVTFAYHVVTPLNTSLNQIDVFASGEAVASGRMANPSTGNGIPVLIRFTSAGNVAWVQTFPDLFTVNGVQELLGGELLVFTNTPTSGGQSINSALVQLTTTGNVIAAQYAGSGSGLGFPMVMGPNRLIFPAMGYEPYLLETDANFQNANCPFTSFQLTAVAQSATVSPITMNVYPHALSMGAVNLLTAVPQGFVDSCTTLPTALPAPRKNTFSIHPNPSNGHFQIQSDETIATIEIWDALGRKMATYQTDSPTFAFELGQPGAYWVRVVWENGTFLTRKVIVAQ